MEERIEKGLWPHSPLKYAQVLEHLTAVVQNQEWFPHDISTQIGGIIIQNIKNEFICHCLAYDAWGRRKRDKHYKFRDAQDAADFYLKKELHLPGDLDGWTVEN